MVSSSRRRDILLEIGDYYPDPDPDSTVSTHLILRSNLRNNTILRAYCSLRRSSKLPEESDA